ncbi:MAG: hypothetical protein DWP95_00715 [Proteobacteria bacterium]|nr:MAG: hypothetical protein DWP95_00715 [Pseudomonadota bacterium]
MLKNISLIPVIALLFACGGPTRLEKPSSDLATLIEVVKLDAGTQQMLIRLSHRKAKVREASTLHCQLQINDAKAVQLPPLQTPELTAYAREVMTWSIPDTFTIPQQPKINYDFDCQLRSPDSRDEHFRSHGTLYRLGNQQPPIYR